MIVGNGMIANRFKTYADNKDIVFFASGVSNSKCDDENEYKRECDLLSNTVQENPEKTIVYISTFSIYDPSESKARYVQHKKQIEDFIIESAKKYLIIRASNIVGKSKNKNTVLNFFVNTVENDLYFRLWKNATRNLLDIDDFYKIVTSILDRNIVNTIVNVANPISNNVCDIVAVVEEYLGKKANYTLVDKGADFTIPLDDILPILNEKGLVFGKDYLPNLLKKYY